MHDAALLRSGAFIPENQLLGLSFARQQARVPSFCVVVELYFHQRQITEDIFGILRYGAAG